MTEPLEEQLLGQLGRGRIGFWHELRARAVLERVPADRPAVVADIGAGAGLLGAELRRLRPQARYRFHEPLGSLEEALVAAHGTENRLADLSEVADADVVAALDVIEHIEDDRGFLEQLIGSTRTGATVVLTVPALPALWSSWDAQLGHHRRYTKATLRRALDGLPVDVTELSYLFPELLLPALARRLARGRGAPASEEFPELPRALDRLLYGLGSVSYRCRRLVPAGTSLLCVARRRAA